MTTTTDNLAYIAVTRGGFVDGACFTETEDTAAWLKEMEHAGMTIQRVSRSEAKRLLWTVLPDSEGRFGRMIVARGAGGEVEVGGWDCPETRADARKWLERGLSLEFVSKVQVGADPLHIFASKAPLGEVLTRQQAINALAGY